MDYQLTAIYAVADAGSSPVSPAIVELKTEKTMSKKLVRTKNVSIKQFRVVNTEKGLFAPIEILKASSFESAMNWCFIHGYDLIEEV